VVYTEFEDVAYSPCGIPYVHGKEIDHFQRLFLATKEAYVQAGIDIRYTTTVDSLDIPRRVVHVVGEGDVPWDSLIVATENGIGDQEGGQEILASYYSIPGKTASGKAFDANGNTAAARTWALGTNLTVTNPHNGRSVNIVINDRGPYGTAYRVGARLDLAIGAARRIGMRGAQYVCVSGV